MTEDEMTLIKFFNSYDNISFYPFYAIGGGRKYYMPDILTARQSLMVEGYIDYITSDPAACELTKKGGVMFSIIQDIEENLNIKL